MKKVLLLVFTLLLSNTLFSQLNSKNNDLHQRQISINQHQNAFGLSEGEFKNLKGSAYSNESFLLGKIYKEGAIIFDNLYLRYNIYSDEIEVRNSGENEKLDFGALVKNSEETIVIYNKVYVFVPFNKSDAKGNYFEILSEQKHSDLYKKTTVTFHQPVSAKTSYDRDKPAEFTQNSIYYLVDKNNGSFLELPSNKNKLLKLLSKDNKKVKEFAKNKKLNLDKDKDLIQLISYYNTLQ